MTCIDVVAGRSRKRLLWKAVNVDVDDHVNDHEVRRPVDKSLRDATYEI
jgi:hypothetical protein